MRPKKRKHSLPVFFLKATLEAENKHENMPKAYPM
jgi:hypothetical protein